MKILSFRIQENNSILCEVQQNKRKFNQTGDQLKVLNSFIVSIDYFHGCCRSQILLIYKSVVVPCSCAGRSLLYIQVLSFIHQKITGATYLNGFAKNIIYSSGFEILWMRTRLIRFQDLNDLTFGLLLLFVFRKSKMAVTSDFRLAGRVQRWPIQQYERGRLGHTACELTLALRTASFFCGRLVFCLHGPLW